EGVRTVGDLAAAILAALPVPLPGEEALRKFGPAASRPADARIRRTRKERPQHIREAPDRGVTETAPAPPAGSLAALPVTVGGAGAGPPAVSWRLFVLLVVLVLLAVPLVLLWW